MVKLKKANKLTTNELRIEKLKEIHTKYIDNFNSQFKDLCDFIKEDALQNQDKGISVTYLMFEISSNKLVGYITLMTDSVSLKGLDNDLKEKLRNKGISYPTLPAIKIGRLCIDDEYRRRGLGQKLFFFALKQLLNINKMVGCRFVTLDAKQEKDEKNQNAIKYYKEKLGFEFLKQKGRREPPMYFDAYKLISQDK